MCVNHLSVRHVIVTIPDVLTYLYKILANFTCLSECLQVPKKPSVSQCYLYPIAN